MLNTKLFNIRLYLEGLKRLKVIGMAVAILSVTISALIPIVQWMNTPPTIETAELVSKNELCIPLICTVFIAPFFFAVLFSFLHERKQSDFFHAIPYTRTCVYLSFVASALTFVFAIQMASALTAGLIWAVNPYTTFFFGDLITLTLMSFLAAAELSAIMMLALSLTGTPVTSMLLFALFTLIIRLVVFYMSSCIDANIDITQTRDIPFFGFTWFLPFGLFMYIVNGPRYVDFNPFTSLSNIIYTVIVTLLVFFAAWFFYKIRKSEMAGNTAPNRIAQHIYRILFTLPFALLLPLFIFIDGSDDVDITLVLVIVVITLLVYYLYELITTKRFKGFGKATLFLPVLVACCLAFCGAYYVVEKVLFAQTPDAADEVVAVSIDTKNPYSVWDGYQEYLLEDSVSYDRQLIERIVEAMNQTVECDVSGSYKKYFASYKYAYGDFTYIDTNWLTVVFTMENGKTVTRRVAFREESFNSIKVAYVNTIEIDPEEFWSLPDYRDIYHISTDMYVREGGYYEDFSFSFIKNTSVAKNFYNTFLEEYNRLTVEQKELIRRSHAAELLDTFESEKVFSLYINGQIFGTGRGYNITVAVVEDMMPNTYKYLTGDNRSKR